MGDLILNAFEGIYYGTNAERLALTVANVPSTTKVYEVDTGNAYVAYKGAWYPV